MKKLFVALFALALATPVFAQPYPNITIDELKAAIGDKSVTILDVNGPETYKDGHIPGAIDYIAVKEDIAAKLPSDKSSLIVAYCGNEACGAYAAAAKAAKDLGYTNVKHFAPGLSGWKAAGESLEKGS